MKSLSKLNRRVAEFKNGALTVEDLWNNLKADLNVSKLVVESFPNTLSVYTDNVNVKIGTAIKTRKSLSKSVRTILEQFEQKVAEVTLVATTSID